MRRTKAERPRQMTIAEIRAKGWPLPTGSRGKGKTWYLPADENDTGRPLWVEPGGSAYEVTDVEAYSAAKAKLPGPLAPASETEDAMLALVKRRAKLMAMLDSLRTELQEREQELQDVRQQLLAGLE